MTGADFCLTSAEVGRWPHWIEDYEIPCPARCRPRSPGRTGARRGLPLPALDQDDARDLRRHPPLLPRHLPHQPDQSAEPGDPGHQRGHPRSATSACATSSRADWPASPGCSASPSPRSPPGPRASTTSPSSPTSVVPTPARTSTRGSDGCGAAATSTTRPPVTAVARQLVRVPWVQLAVEQMYAPLVAHMFREYGLLPCSVDSHIGEYVPFAREVAGWHPVPVYFHQAVGAQMERLVTRYGNGTSHVPDAPGRPVGRGGLPHHRGHVDRTTTAPSTPSTSPTAVTSPTCPRGPSWRCPPPSTPAGRAPDPMPPGARAARRLHEDPDRVAGPGGEGGPHRRPGARLRGPAPRPALTR